jgi:type II secretory pathway pseudopilin PulG
MNNKGFTLIELLVSAGIFAMIIITIIGVFTASIKLQDNILSTKKVIGEINYAMEFMSRNLRMAIKDQNSLCLTNSPNNYNYELRTDSTGIKFKSAFKPGECHEIFLDPINHQIKFSRNGTETDLTSPVIQITKLKFFVSGDGPDDLQPLVTVYLEAKSGNAPAIKVQTSISQRNLDVNY